MGTKKFGTFLFFVHFFGMFMELAITYLLLLPTSDGLFQRASGPYTMIGALMFLFNEYTPRLHPRFVSGLGFDFSEKVCAFSTNTLNIHINCDNLFALPLFLP